MNADLILEILDKVDEKRGSFSQEAKKRGITVNQLVAAAISEALEEWMDTDLLSPKDTREAMYGAISAMVTTGLLFAFNRRTKSLDKIVQASINGEMIQLDVE